MENTQVDDMYFQSSFGNEIWKSKNDAFIEYRNIFEIFLT